MTYLPDFDPCIRFVDGAKLLPLTKEVGDPITCNGGVLDSFDNPVSLAYHHRAYQYNMPGEWDGTSEAERLHGSHFYGGVLFGNHFGHIAAESLGRLWAVRYLNSDYNSVVFLTSWLGKEHTYPRFLEEIFEIFGISVPITLIRRPTEVDMLVVPSQLSGLGGRHVPHIEMKKFAQKAIGRIPNSVARDKVYVSRAAFSGLPRSIVEEQVIERLLEESGYFILRPEKSSIAEQVYIYSTAKKIIFSEGSALHFFAYFRKPEQKVGVILRRSYKREYKWAKYPIMGVDEAVQIDGVEWSIWNKSHRFPRNTAISSVDFRFVFKSLYEAGFLERDISDEVEPFDARGVLESLKGDLEGYEVVSMKDSIGL